MRTAGSARATIHPDAEAVVCGLGRGHRWVVDSSHRTSEGMVTYESCRCGTRRVRCDDVPLAQTRLGYRATV